MAIPSTADQLLGILHKIVVALVRRDGPDPSARQQVSRFRSPLHWNAGGIGTLALCFSWPAYPLRSSRNATNFEGRTRGIFLIRYLQSDSHTVRNLASDLNLSNPAVSRALNRLGELDLARRKIDPADRSRVVVQSTLKGTAFLRDLRYVLSEATLRAPRNGEHSEQRPSPN